MSEVEKIYLNYSEYDNAHGLSIYWPEEQAELEYDFDYYQESVPFSAETQWDEFCKKFVELNDPS